MKFSARYIAYVALLAAVSVVLNIFDIPLGPDLKLSATYIPDFFAGFFFGPAAGFFVGCIGDVLGCIIAPKGPWLPVLTLSSALMGLIPGLIRYIPLNEKVLLVLSFMATYFICSFCINNTLFWYLYSSTKKTLWVYMIGRIVFTLPDMLICMIVSLVIMPYFKKAIPNLQSFQRKKEAA